MTPKPASEKKEKRVHEAPFRTDLIQIIPGHSRLVIIDGADNVLDTKTACKLLNAKTGDVERLQDLKELLSDWEHHTEYEAYVTPDYGERKIRYRKTLTALGVNLD